MPSRVSTATKSLRRTLRPCRVKALASVPTSDAAPQAPADLPPATLPHWKALAAILTPLGTLAPSDAIALSLLARTLASIDSYEAAIEREGVTIAGKPPGSLRAHPAVAALQAARTLARALLRDFGLSPASRESVGAAPTPEPVNRFAEFARS